MSRSHRNNWKGNFHGNVSFSFICHVCETDFPFYYPLGGEDAFRRWTSLSPPAERVDGCLEVTRSAACWVRGWRRPFIATSWRSCSSAGRNSHRGEGQPARWLTYWRAAARTKVGFWLVSRKVVWWRFHQSWFDSCVCIIALWSRTALTPTTKEAGLLNITKWWK